MPFMHSGPGTDIMMIRAVAKAAPDMVLTEPQERAQMIRSQMQPDNLDFASSINDDKAYDINHRKCVCQHCCQHAAEQLALLILRLQINPRGCAHFIQYTSSYH